jgi:archaellum component FlaC
MYEDIKNIPTIIINGMSKEQILRIMKTIKNMENLPENIIFASITPTSSRWTVEELIKELKQEDIEMKKVTENLKKGVYDNYKKDSKRE